MVGLPSSVCRLFPAVFGDGVNDNAEENQSDDGGYDDNNDTGSYSYAHNMLGCGSVDVVTNQVVVSTAKLSFNDHHLALCRRSW